MPFTVGLLIGLPLVIVFVAIRYRRTKKLTINDWQQAVLGSFGVSAAMATVILPAARLSYLYVTGDSALIRGGQIYLSSQDFDSILLSAVIGSLLTLAVVIKSYIDNMR